VWKYHQAGIGQATLEVIGKPNNNDDDDDDDDDTRLSVGMSISHL